MCWNATYKKYDFLQDKWKYSMFDTSCQMFWIRITKIPESHITKNTVMSDKHTVTLQNSKLFVPTVLPIIVLQRVEELFLAYRGIMVSAVCLRNCMAQWTKYFLVFLYYLSFSVFSDFKNGFLYP